MIRVLVACEESQEVCKAFRERGAEAYSCDIQPCSGGHPEWHVRNDVTRIIQADMFFTEDRKLHKDIVAWDLIIAFPPCTDLAVSGARWFKEKQMDGRQQNSIGFFLYFTHLDCEHVAIENPIGIMSTVYRKPDQIIQPWQFGHGETKATCLWLKGLPNLEPTNIVPGRENRIWKMSPSLDRAKLRSKTYPGIAAAMAEQWLEYIENENRIISEWGD